MKLNKNNIIIISACFIYILSLCSFGSKKVELLDNAKLLDFDKAIKVASPGADSNENIEDGELLPESPESTGTAAITSVTENNESKEKIIEIRVSKEDIYYQDNIVDFEMLKNKILENNSKKVEFSVLDDYAEFHVMLNVIALTERLKTDYNIVVNYEFELIGV